MRQFSIPASVFSSAKWGCKQEAPKVTSGSGVEVPDICIRLPHGSQVLKRVSNSLASKCSVWGTENCGVPLGLVNLLYSQMDSQTHPRK